MFFTRLYDSSAETVYTTSVVHNGYNTSLSISHLRESSCLYLRDVSLFVPCFRNCTAHKSGSALRWFPFAFQSLEQSTSTFCGGYLGREKLREPSQTLLLNCYIDIIPR